ncbi:hypothetical protein IG631_00223 [Alternaria alternata]|nr:hypothetical protein IG631_00223 [Alternaria alternata]
MRQNSHLLQRHSLARKSKPAPARTSSRSWHPAHASRVLPPLLNIRQINCQGGMLASQNAMRMHKNALVSGSRGGNALVLLLEPVLLGQHSVVLALGALNVDCLCFVCLELVRDVGLLGGSGGLGDSELLDVALSVAGLDFGNLVVLELAEVQVLH